MPETPVFQIQRSHSPEALKTNYMLAGNFTLDMHDFFYSRMDRVRPNQSSRQYARQNVEYCQLFDKLKGMLPDHGTKLLFDLDSSIGAMSAEEQDMLFRSGFSDGVRFIMHALSGAGL